MAKYRTAQGKVLDMAQLAAKNDKTRAVGNKKVNARGDTIDNQGRVIVPVNRKVNETYQRGVANRATNIVRDKTDIDDHTSILPDTENINDFTKEELETLDTFDDVDEIKKTNDTADFLIKPASEAPEFFEPETPTKSKKTK